LTTAWLVILKRQTLLGTRTATCARASWECAILGKARQSRCQELSIPRPALPLIGE